LRFQRVLPERSGGREKMSMRLGRTAEDLEFDSSLGVDGENSGDGRVGIVAPDDDELAGDGHETEACVSNPRPEAPVICHVHEVNSNVVAHAFSTTSLIGMFATGVRDRIVKASIESKDRQLGQIGEDDGEVREIERGEECKAGGAETPECREAICR
jgi:hypothetical protein